MKANELMIGDIVRVAKDVCIPKGTIVSIKEIDADNRFVEKHLVGSATCLPINNEDAMTGSVWVEYLEPIPLTPEILEKNGFIKDTDEDDRVVDKYHLLVPTGYERNSYTIQVSLYKEPICGVSTLVKCWGWIPPYNGGMNDIHLCSANYVHQLQHAMRLCGIEKEIEL